MAIQFDGGADTINFGDVGIIRSISMWTKPNSVTEEFLLVDTGKDIGISSGTVTYVGLTATDTFVDGVSTTTLVADRWQHLVCVLNADVDANNLEAATDGTNFGNVAISDIKIYDRVLTNLQVIDLIKK